MAAAEAAGAGSTKHARTEYGKSSAVFAKIQEQVNMDAAAKVGIGTTVCQAQVAECQHVPARADDLALF